MKEIIINTVLIIVDMQNDFILKKGSCSLPGAEEKLMSLEAKTTFQRLVKDANTIIATRDIHNKEDIEFSKCPPHCIINSFGSDYIDYVKDKVIKDAIIISKRTSDTFNTKGMWESLLFAFQRAKGKPLNITVIGVATDIAVYNIIRELNDMTEYLIGNITVIEKLCYASNKALAEKQKEELRFVKFV